MEGVMIIPMKARKWQQKTFSAYTKAVREWRKPEALRAITLACAGAGKSFFAGMLMAHAVSLGKRAMVVITMGYLAHEFHEGLQNAGVKADEISILSAEYPGMFFSDRPIQVVMVQTGDARPTHLDELLAYKYQYCVVDECHTAFNFSAWVEMAEKLQTKSIMGLTATYIKGTLLIDEKARKHGVNQLRAHEGHIYSAGDHAEMVAEKICRPIVYKSVAPAPLKKGTKTDLRSAESIDFILSKWQEECSSLSHTMFFVPPNSHSADEGHAPIDLYESALKKLGCNVIRFGAKTKRSDVAVAREAVSRIPRTVIITVQFGKVGLNIPALHTVVLGTAMHDSPEGCIQGATRANRFTAASPSLHTTILDAGANFTIPGVDGAFDTIELQMRKLVHSPEDLLVDRFKEPGGKGKPPSKGAGPTKVGLSGEVKTLMDGASIIRTKGQAGVEMYARACVDGPGWRAEVDRAIVAAGKRPALFVAVLKKIEAESLTASKL